MHFTDNFSGFRVIVLSYSCLVENVSWHAHDQIIHECAISSIFVRMRATLRVKKFTVRDVKYALNLACFALLRVHFVLDPVTISTHLSVREHFGTDYARNFASSCRFRAVPLLCDALTVCTTHNGTSWMPRDHVIGIHYIHTSLLAWSWVAFFCCEREERE